MDKNEVDSFLDGLNNEPKDDPLKADIEDIFPKKEVKEDKDEEKEEKPLAFHKDPKVQKFIEKEINKRLADIEPEERKSSKEESSSTDELSDVLTRIIGNDTPEKIAAVRDFKKALGGLEEKGAQRALQELEQRAEIEERADEEAETELSDGFERVEEEFHVDLTSNSPQVKRVRNEFIDFIERVAPKDEYGQVTEYPDFEETFRLFKDTRKPASNQRAKDLASRSMTRSGDASVSAPREGTSWKDVDKIFSKLEK